MEEVGFGTRRSEQTFTDPGRLSAAWQVPGRVGTQEIFVAEMEGLVVGYVTLEDRDTELELNTIAVLGSHQGRGIGSRLVQFVEERARDQGKQAVTLGTSRNAAGTPWRSFSWWLTHGFRVVGEEENVWTRAIGPGVREIRMRKEIGPR